MAKLDSTQIYGDLQVNGEIKNKATTQTEGIVKLNDTVTSTSTTEAATANAIKTVYDKANHDHPYAEKTVATTSVNGLMSSNDKVKLDGIATNANNYIHPTNAGNKHIPTGGVAGQILRWSTDGTATWGNENRTVYLTATTISDGLMSSTDKVKLDGIDTGANKTILNNTVISTSTTESATAYAVKLAYDKANHEHPYAAINHGTHVSYGESTSPLINNAVGTPGIATTVSRSDHTHELPTSIPANGGNSDTVDGKHASDFATSSHVHNEYAATTHTHDIYALTVHTHNYASSEHEHSNYSLTTHTHTEFAPSIHAHDYAAIIHSHNEYSLTGHTHDYSASNHTHNYLPLAGGTLTGTVIAPIFSGSLNGNANTATKLATARNITVGSTTRSFDGSGSIAFTLTDIGAANSSHVHTEYAINTHIHSEYALTIHNHTEYSLTDHIHKDYAILEHTHNYASTTHTHNYAASSTPGGSATSAIKLNTGRKITIGNKINVFDGSTDINFTLTDIGAAASSHIHDYAANNHNHNQIICTDITQLDNYDGLTITDSNVSSSAGYDSNYSQIINIKSASGTTQIVNETEWEEPTLKVRQRYLNYEWGPFYKIYHSGSKPTPSEIGAALSNHTHNNYAPGKVGTGENSVIFNANTNKANGLNAIAQGGDTSASGICSHAEGNFTVAAGDYSHAEGIDTRTFASAGHAEGSGTMAVGAASHTEGTNSTAWAQNSHAEGYDTQTSGAASHAEGNSCVASGNYSHVEGDGSQSDGQSSHAEGQECISAELGSHAEGGWTEANGEFSHAEGNGSYANGANSHAEGEETKTWGANSHSEGKNTTAIGEFSHIEGGSSYNLSTVIPGLTGTETSAAIESKWIANSSPGSPSAKSFSVAYGSSSHVEGWNCIALGSSAHAEGFYSFAKGIGAHAEGCLTVANGTYSHAKGHYSTASGFGSYAEGGKTNAIGDYTHTEGYGTTAETYNVHVQGRYNKVNSGSDINYSSTQNAFVIGNGTSSTVLSNAFRVTFNGKTYGLSAFNSTGADYAEYFEWQDKNPNNEDRIGRFVTLDENKIKIANSMNDYIIGVISGNASIIGNSNEDGWNEMYARDMFGRLQYEDVEVHETKQVIEKLVDEVHIEKRIKLNPSYNSTMEYIPRSERREWDTVGMLGQIPVIDDGTCEPNGFCTVSDGGIATKSSIGYRVIKRLSDNIVLIIFK